MTQNAPENPSTMTAQDVERGEIASWLKQLQRQSWELELLVTGFSIFLLLQIPGGVDKMIAAYKAGDMIFRSGLVVTFLEFARVTAGVITFNLVVHVILRGIWIGLVGLSSVFPQGIPVEKLKLSPVFSERLVSHRFDMEAAILSLDKVASTIFSFTFLIGCYAVSLSLFNTVFLLFLHVWVLTMVDQPGVFRIGALVLMGVYYFIGLLGVLNFLTMDGFKRNRHLARFYRYIDAFLSRLTLSIFYRPIHYTLAGNYNRYLVHGLTLIYLAVFVALSMRQTVNHSVWYPMGGNYYKAVYYDNLRPPNAWIETAALESDQLKGDQFKVFIRYHAEHDALVRRVCPKLEVPIEGSVYNIFDLNYSTNFERPEPGAEEAYSKQALTCAAEIYKFYLNGELLEPREFFYAQHPNKGEKGYVTWLPLPAGGLGGNVLKIEIRNTPKRGKVWPPFITLVEIPFRMVPK